MGTASFIKQMEDMGIHLWVEDEKLKFRAPEGVVDEKIRESLKANKQAIIVYFKDRMAPVHEGKIDMISLNLQTFRHHICLEAVMRMDLVKRDVLYMPCWTHLALMRKN